LVSILFSIFRGELIGKPWKHHEATFYFKLKNTSDFIKRF